MKLSLITLFTLIAVTSLPSCTTSPTLDNVASACEQGINSLNQRLNSRSLSVHQTNLSRANSLLVAARVQHQFAEYPGCLDKLRRAQDYISGRQSAVISRLSI